jgi:hypothetical protein
LPCIACPATVNVSERKRREAIEIRCPWAICRECQDRKGEE